MRYRVVVFHSVTKVSKHIQNHHRDSDLVESLWWFWMCGSATHPELEFKVAEKCVAFSESSTPHRQ